MKAKTPGHAGRVQDGKFIADDRDFFLWDVGSFEGQRVEVVIRSQRRSNDHNAYYWAGIVRVFVDFFNKEKSFNRVVDKEFVHEILKIKFLGYEKILMPDNEVIEKVKDSKSLSGLNFYDFTMYAKQWGEEMFNLTFPEPPKKEDVPRKENE